MPDRYNLIRFVEAQARVWDAVIDELRRGRKRSHWMWFVFPQLTGLGSSETARYYGIASLDEAKAYLAHQTLGHHLQKASRLVLQAESVSAQEIFGYPDYLKLRSSMTLFDAACEAPDIYRSVLDKYYEGQPDQMTLQLLGRTSL